MGCSSSSSKAPDQYEEERLINIIRPMLNENENGSASSKSFKLPRKIYNYYREHPSDLKDLTSQKDIDYQKALLLMYCLHSNKNNDTFVRNMAKEKLYSTATEEVLALWWQSKRYPRGSPLPTQNDNPPDWQSA